MVDLVGRRQLYEISTTRGCRVFSTDPRTRESRQGERGKLLIQRNFSRVAPLNLISIMASEELTTKKRSSAVTLKI